MTEHNRTLIKRIKIRRGQKTIALPDIVLRGEGSGAKPPEYAFEWDEKGRKSLCIYHKMTEPQIHPTCESRK